MEISRSHMSSALWGISQERWGSLEMAVSQGRSEEGWKVKSDWSQTHGRGQTLAEGANSGICGPQKTGECFREERTQET